MLLSRHPRSTVRFPEVQGSAALRLQGDNLRPCANVVAQRNSRFRNRKIRSPRMSEQQIASSFAIRPAGDDDVAVLTEVISRAFDGVAVRFGLTRENCPAHTSFITEDEIRRGMGFGNQYFLATDGDVPGGTVAVRDPKEGIGIIEKMAVLPELRHRGLGRALMAAAFAELRRRGAVATEIGIIAADAVLRKWYESQGFTVLRQTRYDHLPFDVLYMRKQFGAAYERLR
jgi:GNAT superfamily N-acetyltransferase